MANWPGFDETPPMVVLRPSQTRPNRPRHQSEAFVPQLAPNGQTVMVDQFGRLMMPVDQWGRPQRSSSVSGNRPQNIIIQNGITHTEDNERPLSAHGWHGNEGALMERRPSNRSHSRNNSIVRRRRLSRTPDLFDDEYDEYIDDLGRPVRYRIESPRPRQIRSKEDEEKIRELEAKEKELKELREKEKEKQRKKQLEEQIALEELEKEKKRKDREAADKKLKELAIEEYKEKSRKEKEKAEKERQQKEDEIVELLRTEGYSEAEARRKLKRMEKRKEKGITADDDRGESDTRLMKSKPTYIKVHSKYISPDTLDVFQLPWEFDDRDSGYIIIKQWVDERNQEILFNHTKQMADHRRLTYSKEALKEDHSRLIMPKKDKPRKKSPVKQISYFLT